MSARLRSSLALVIILTYGTARADDYVLRQGNNTASQITMRCKMVGSACVPLSGLLDSNGNPVNAANPMPTAPGIAPVIPVDHGGTIAAANTAQSVMGINATRKGGWITADPNNNGTLYISLTGTASTTPGAGKQCVLTPGASCPLTVNGYVVQTAVSIAGTVATDAYEAVEFQ